MTQLNLPKTFDLGGGELVEVKYLETLFGITHRVALKYLKVLRIKPMYIGKEVFFSLPTFKKIMYVLSRPGAPGFLFPASPAKQNASLREKGFLIEITDELLAQAASPQIMGEMVASEGRDTSMIKKLVTHPSSTGKDKK